HGRACSWSPRTRSCSSRATPSRSSRGRRRVSSPLPWRRSGQESSCMFMEGIRASVKGRGKRVVFPEGVEKRALGAAARRRDQGLVQPIVIGREGQVRERAQAFGLDLAGIEIGDPEGDPRLADYAQTYYELRKHKGVTPEAAATKARLPHYFGAL